MAKSDATIVDAGGRDLRVSIPERVIFPGTDHSGPVTKLDVVNYYLAVGDGIMRALARRPTTLERWPKGVHPGIVLSTREKGGGDAFFQKRVPKGAPDYLETARIEFPSGRHADEICPTEIAVVGDEAEPVGVEPARDRVLCEGHTHTEPEYHRRHVPKLPDCP